MSTAAKIVELHETSGDQVAHLLNAIPGITTLAQLVAIDPNELSASSRIDYLTALERQTAWLQALMQRAIIAVAGNEPSVSNGDDIFFGVDEAEREDVSTALRLSAGTAQSRIDVARTLVNHLPNTCSALATGDISLAHANVIAKETAAAIRDGLTEFQIFEVEQRAIAHAEFHTPAQVANQVRTSLARIAPETFVGEVVMRTEMTAFLLAAQERGCRVQVGSDMLFEQIPAYLEYFGFKTSTADDLRSVARLG